MHNISAFEMICDSFDEILLDNESIKFAVHSLNRKKLKSDKLLSESVQYFTTFNSQKDIGGIYFGLEKLSINNELSDKISLKIAQELAIAIDKNSVEQVKILKNKYSKLKEFVLAKDFLNKKCQQIWDVFEQNSDLTNIPKAAMKCLGITNQPSLEFLLENSLKYYEKDNGTTTVDIIKSILKNKNLDYTFEDIYKYLKLMNKKNGYKYNFKTVAYLLENFNYDKTMIDDLGICTDELNEALKTFSLIQKFNYLFKNLFLNFSYKRI